MGVLPAPGGALVQPPECAGRALWTAPAPPLGSRTEAGPDDAGPGPPRCAGAAAVSVRVVRYDPTDSGFS
ncbi:hypothetical protein GCM10010343_28030 [Streptomyces avidinii]|nr:hypothetical protein GCM10010343_28030 [Streptomyces avidinii]